MDSRIKMLFAILLAFTAIGCAGIKTFNDTVQVGQTIAIPIGQKKHFTQDDMTVTVTPSGGSPVIVTAPNAAIRGVVNFYPDPLSPLEVCDEVNFDVTNSCQTYASQIKANYSGGVKDFWQTVVFFNMPDLGGATGTTTIALTNSHSESASLDVNVVSGTGTAHALEGVGSGVLVPDHIKAMERLDHFEVAFAYGGAPVPYAVELNLDYTNSLIGHIVNPRGTVKNIYWRDTGSGYKVIMLPSKNALESIKDFNFYVAVGFGFDGLTTLNVDPASIKAYDINGSPIAGVTASTNLVHGTGGLF